MLPAGAKVFKLPPPASVLKLNSATGSELKGREIIRKFREGWFVGRVLKQASDQSIKDGARIANYRIFYEADDELLSQALYANSYGRDASSGGLVDARRDARQGTGGGPRTGSHAPSCWGCGLRVGGGLGQRMGCIQGCRA